MKVLVTGATGFVGGALVRRLVGMEMEVHVFIRGESDLWRIRDIQSGLVRHLVDLRDEVAVGQTVAAIRPHVIYHLATYGGFADQRDSSAIFAANLMGTVYLLRACENVGFHCFVNTGSSSEYGIKTAPMGEGDLLEPIGDYGVTKSAATLFCRSEALQKELPVVTLRLFSPYGPWDDPKRFVPYVMKSLLRGEPPRLSTPDSVRDYIYIDDVVDLYLKVSTVPQLSGEIFNVGSGVQHSLGEVVSLIGEIIGNGIEPVWGAAARRRVEPHSWVADMGRTKRATGWEPSTQLRAGLRSTVAWLRDHLEHYP